MQLLGVLDVRQPRLLASRMALKNKLKELRGDLSQHAAAKLAGISQQQWSKLERGVIPIELTTSIPQIAAAFGKEIQWFYNDHANLPEQINKAKTISQLTLALAEILENDPELRGLVLALATQYQQDRKRGAEIAKAIKTLVGMA